MNRIWYGGDYAPEQWSSEVWDDDVRLMQQAGVTVVTVGVFAWALLEPADDEWDFSWLDDVLSRLDAGGIRVDLATATASPPPWLTRGRPEVLPVTEDGVRLSIGSRGAFNPSSAAYACHAQRLVRKLAERYRDHPALEAWHVGNELAAQVPRDYGEESAARFRTWLLQRYGSLDGVNDAWGTRFWSQRYGSIDEVTPPRAAPAARNPTQLLDFDRFSTDAWTSLLRAEVSILREVTPHVPVTTNLMGFNPRLDSWAVAREVDFVSDDHYPDPADPASPAVAAAVRDLTRSLGDGPWILMEQAPGAVSWRRRNATKPPGLHRLHSLQAVARGADGVMQFQWRQSVAGAEKFHSAMVPHVGPDSRLYREAAALGEELARLCNLVGVRQDAEVAIVLDWDSWRALEQDETPARLDYVRILLRWHARLLERGVLVDFVEPAGDFTHYAVVIAPATQVLSADARRAMVTFTENGGHLVVGYQTSVLDENLHVLPGGAPGDLADLLGLRVEEFTPPAGPPGSPTPTLEITGLGAGCAEEWAEVIRVRDAEVLATFVGGMLEGLPAITRRAAGAGVAWYLGTAPHDLGAVVDRVLGEAGVQWAFSVLPPQTEAIRRGDRMFLLNWGSHPTKIAGYEIGPLDAAILPT